MVDEPAPFERRVLDALLILLVFLICGTRLVLFRVVALEETIGDRRALERARVDLIFGERFLLVLFLFKYFAIYGSSLL